MQRQPLRTAVLALAALLAVAAASCTRGSPHADVSTATGSTAEATAMPALQPDDLVNLTVYFRSGEGSQAHLVKVVREVPVTDDLPRRALDVLLAGPTDGDPRELDPALPPSTRVLSFSVDGSTAQVDLSAAVITDARTIGHTAANEPLALAALANTLTEFPTIERVRLSVEGSSEGRVGSVDVDAFWGWWGLPEILVRDESLVGPSPEYEALGDVTRFSLEDQATGSADGQQVQVTSVRLRDRVTQLRLVVELADPADADISAKAPPARVRARDGELVLEVNDVAAYNGDLAPGQLLQVVDPGFGAARVDVRTLPGPLRVVLTPHAPRAFWLHTLSNPTRIVLDVMKTEARTASPAADATES